MAGRILGPVSQRKAESSRLRADRPQLGTWKWKCEPLSHVPLYVAQWAIACHALLSMGLSRKNTGVGCHSILQVIFPTQGSNLGLPHGRQILYCLSHQGKQCTWVEKAWVLEPEYLGTWFDLWDFLAMVPLQSHLTSLSLSKPPTKYEQQWWFEE